MFLSKSSLRKRAGSRNETWAKNFEQTVVIKLQKIRKKIGKKQQNILLKLYKTTPTCQ